MSSESSKAELNLTQLLIDIIVNDDPNPVLCCGL